MLYPRLENATTRIAIVANHNSINRKSVQANYDDSMTRRALEALGMQDGQRARMYSRSNKQTNNLRLSCIFLGSQITYGLPW